MIDDDDAVGRLSGCVALTRSLIFLPYFQLETWEPIYFVQYYYGISTVCPPNYFS